MERTRPTPLVGSVANSRHDQQVARARGGHVREPNPLSAIPLDFVVLVIEQVERLPPGQTEGAQASLGIDEAVSRLAM